jgi:hypothetical protein
MFSEGILFRKTEYILSLLFKRKARSTSVVIMPSYRSRTRREYAYLVFRLKMRVVVNS